MDLQEASTEYVKMIEGIYLVGETRGSLDSLVYLFREGLSAQSMVESYPALTLEQVHGALAFYLGHRNEIDAYLSEGRREAQSRRGVEAHECGVDRKTTAGAPCQSDSRLTRTSTVESFAGCGG